MKPRSRNFTAGIIAGVIIALLAVVILQQFPAMPSASYAADQAAATLVRQQLQNQSVDLATAFQQVAVVMRPSVVSVISVSHNEGVGNSQQIPNLPPEFKRFFGDDLPGFQMQPPGNFESRGQGSGVIVSDDGYILTNNHVIRGADEVTVILSDDRELAAEVIGGDADTDLAILKVNATGLEPAVLGDSDALHVGEWVVAVGSPMGLDQTVTSGIVSALGRNGVGVAQFEDFIQTDAAINPGNSGGPLVNLQGEVVGINTAIASQNGGFSGIGFSIPTSMIRHVMEDIIADGQVTRGYLGAAVQNLNEDLAASFGYEGTRGVLIGDVVDDSPAARGGLEAGDIVLSIDGREMDSAHEMVNAVAAVDPGDEIDVVVFREGRERELKIEVGTRPGNLTAASGSRNDSTGEPAEGAALGVKVRELTPELAEEYSLGSGASGVVVTEVEPGSLAAQAGLRTGDQIVSIGNRRIGSLEDFASASSDLDLETGVRLQVRTGSTQRFVFLRG